MPDEVLKHADAVVIGEAENIWGKVLEDFKKGSMKGKYKAETFHDMKGMPWPRLDLLNNPDLYSTAQYVQTTRGCPFNCEFCSTSPFWGTKYRMRPVDEVVEEIKRFDRKKGVFIVDDDIAAVPARAKELFEKLIPLKIKWASQCGVSIAKHDEILKLARKSGCVNLFLGLESPDENSIKSVDKMQNHPREFKNIVSKIRSYGIGVQGAFVVGLDNDSKYIFNIIDNFIIKAKLDAFQVNVLYPYPGTRIRERIITENRLTSNDYSNYILNGINFIPKNMSQEELNKGYKWLLKKHTTYGAIFKKVSRAFIQLGVYPSYIALVLNIGTRRSLKHILLNPDPIKKPGCEFLEHN